MLRLKLSSCDKTMCQRKTLSFVNLKDEIQIFKEQFNQICEHCPPFFRQRQLNEQFQQKFIQR